MLRTLQVLSAHRWKQGRSLDRMLALELAVKQSTGWVLLCGGLTRAGFTSPCGSSGPRVAVRKLFGALREYCRCACLSSSTSGRLLLREHTERSGCSWTVLSERAPHAAARSEPRVMALIWRSWGSVDTAFCSVGHQWAF